MPAAATVTAPATASRRAFTHPGVERRCFLWNSKITTSTAAARPVLAAATTCSLPFTSSSSSVLLQRDHVGAAPGWSSSCSPLTREGRSVRAFQCATVAPAPLRRRPRHSRTTNSSNDDAEGDADHTSSTASGMSLSPVPVTDPQIFDRAALKLLDKIESALRPLEPLNRPCFALVRSGGGSNSTVREGVMSRDTPDDDDDDDSNGTGERLHLDLGPVHGFYELRVNASKMHVMLSSPISGQHLYVLSEGTGTFCSHDDGHSLEGLLVRDLIRQIYGVPQL